MAALESVPASIATSATKGTSSATVTNPVLTSITQTVEDTISQPASTFVTTRAQTILITDSAQYSSLLASEASVASDRSTGTHTSSSTTPLTTTTQQPSSTFPLILGVALGIVGLLLIGSLVVVYMIWRRKRRQERVSGPAAEKEWVTRLAEPHYVLGETGRVVRTAAEPFELANNEVNVVALWPTKGVTARERHSWQRRSAVELEAGNTVHGKAELEAEHESRSQT